MNILTKYICRRLIIYYLAFVAVMLTFVVFVDFMENMGRIIKHHAPPALIAEYYACFLPKVFVELSWITFLVAVLFVLGSMAKNNEFTAMLAGGISIYQVGAYVLTIGVLLSLVVFCVQEFIVPPGALRADELYDSHFAQGPREKRIFGIAKIGGRNTFYYFDVLDAEAGILTGVHIYKNEGSSVVERVDASEAIWNETKKRWYLKDGVTRKFDSGGAVVESTPFTSAKAPFKESPRTLEVSSSSGGELNFRQLRRQIKNLQRNGYDAHRLKVNYYRKFSFPAANFIVVFLGLPFALECRRGGLTIGFALSLMAALLYYGAFQVGLALGMGGVLPAVVASWLANFLFLGLGTSLTMRART